MRMERDFTQLSLSLRRKLSIALIATRAPELCGAARLWSLPGEQRRMQKDGAGGQGQVNAKIAVSRRLVQVFLERAANLFPVSSWAPKPKSLKIPASFRIAVRLLIAHPGLLLKSRCWDSAALICEPTFSLRDMARPFKCYHGQQQLWCSCAELLKIEHLSPPFPCGNAERVQPPHPPHARHPFSCWSTRPAWLHLLGSQEARGCWPCPRATGMCWANTSASARKKPSWEPRLSAFLCWHRAVRGTEQRATARPNERALVSKCVFVAF